MNPFKNWMVGRGARADARSGLDSVEERIVAELGPRPRLDPAGNSEHAELVRVLGDRARVEELREDVVRAENEIVNHALPLAYNVGLVVAVAIEVLGAVLIMKVLGIPPSERLPLGAALALALILITAVTAHRRVPPPRAEGSLGSRAAQAAKRSIWSLFVLGTYSVVVLAIAVVRVRNSLDEETSQLELVAQALLMLATAIAPAWATEWLLRGRAPAVAVRRRARVERRRLRDAERAHERARAAVNRIAREGAQWDSEAARRRALYVTHHRLQAAKGTT